MELKIGGYSTALFSTWFYVENLDLLFDAGDGLMAHLKQKSRKIKHIFLSHADRDHITGIMQFNQLNARDGKPDFYYPADSGSIPALRDFMERFDPHVKPATWQPIRSGEEIIIKDRYAVQAFRNEHVEVPFGKCKSLSYVIKHQNKKLKSEFKELSSEQIKDLVMAKGKASIPEVHEKKILAYSGDTPIGNQDVWNNTEVLIHEATFLNMKNIVENHQHKHSLLEDVIKMTSELNIGKLVLSHFSVRYNHEEIDENIKGFCKKYQIKFPVYRILPGQFSRDLLAEDPLN